jgi:hypothetical protein
MSNEGMGLVDITAISEGRQPDIPPGTMACVQLFTTASTFSP